MGTHNICFHRGIRKILSFLAGKFVLSRAMQTEDPDQTEQTSRLVLVYEGVST